MYGIDTTRDPLTGCFDRAYGMHLLQILTSGAAKQTREFAVALIDIDEFKQVNDRRGHPTGDEALWEIAKLLELSFTQRNPVCRIGGDEFLVLFPDAPTAHLITLLEQAKREVSREAGRPIIRQSLPLTITVGLAFYPRHGQTPEELLKAADVALYHGKQMGGNQVTSA